jgi:RNA polymerase sigma-70 factor, ECF subfamily
MTIRAGTDPGRSARAPVYPQLVTPVGAAQLAERIRAGDAAAFETFFHQLYPPLVAFLRHRTGSASAAEDLAQDAFVALWQKRADIDPDRSLRAYLFRTARNAATSHGRRRRLEERVRRWFRLDPAPIRAPDDHTSDGELRAALRTAIAALPPRCREVFLLARDAHMSYAEIANSLGLSPRTVENHMGHALRLLRTSLHDHRRSLD